ncbi:hypothetical protein RND81_09G101600 [Saponaria officinalis]|uniref:Late embryogenesis abundant protein LEA-2 subgroup domain-containing protein n=1 Tax=Saponaria officinalis TaxID=3572 RepID=A0AAW1IKY7_SAPOF
MHSTKCIITTTMLVGLLIIFAIGGIPLIVYYAQNPKDPTFTLEHASVSGFNLTSDGHLTSFFDIIIKANNPNHKMKLGYSGIRVSIFKDKQDLAQDALYNFIQPKKNVTLLRSNPVALNVSLGKAPGFNLGFESGVGYVDFDVFMTAILDGDNLEVNCKHAIVNLTTSSSSSLVDASKTSFDGDNKVGNNNFRSVDCRVYIYNNDDD